jgi:pimeloyl-ACP methyl ester carboxylesterase
VSCQRAFSWHPVDLQRKAWVPAIVYPCLLLAEAGMKHSSTTACLQDWVYPGFYIMKVCMVYKKILLFFIFILLCGCSTYPQPERYSIIKNCKQIQPGYAHVKHGQLEFYQFGYQGSPVVLIEGYGSDITGWNRQFLYGLAQQHQVIVFNNRNVGGSYTRSNHYLTQDLANDADDLIHKLGLKKPTIIGISMGGMIAQQLAVLHPHDIQSLVLINTAIAGKGSVPPSDTVKNQILNMPKDKAGRYALAVNLFFPPEWRLRMSFSLANDRFLPAKFIGIDGSLDKALWTKQRMLVLNWTRDNDTAKKMRHLNVPTLILNGQADQVIPPVNSDILAHVIPHAELVRWPHGGHAMIYQYPLEMAAVINDFIEEKGLSAP